jgi:hypothetical protein
MGQQGKEKKKKKNGMNIMSTGYIMGQQRQNNGI